MADTPAAAAIVAASDPDTWAKRFSGYGSLFVTVCIFALFFICLLVPAPEGTADLKETVKALAMVAAGFWLGSSNSSQKKDATNAALGAALATSTPTVSPEPTEPSDEAKALAARAS